MIFRNQHKQQGKNIKLHFMPFKPATCNLFDLLGRRYYTKTNSWEGRCFAVTTNKQLLGGNLWLADQMVTWGMKNRACNLFSKFIVWTCPFKLWLKIEERKNAYPGRNYLSLRAFWAKALNLEDCWTASFFLSSNRLWRDSPSGLLAMAFTAVNGIAENITTPAT